MTLQFNSAKKAFYTPALMLSVSLALGACSSSSDDDAAPAGDNTNTNAELAGLFAFASTTDFSTAQIERISLADGYVVNGKYPETTGDIRVEAFGNAVYQLGRQTLAFNSALAMVKKM